MDWPLVGFKDLGDRYMLKFFKSLLSIVYIFEILHGIRAFFKKEIWKVKLIC